MAGAKWFKFYPDDWLASPVVQTMTPLEEITYLRLLLFDWAGDGLEPNMERLAMLTRTDVTSVEAVVERAFSDHPKIEGRITNLRLHALREEMQKQQTQRVEAAQKSVEARRKARTNTSTKRKVNERSTGVGTTAKRALNEYKNREDKKEDKKKELIEKKSSHLLPSDWVPKDKEVAAENGIDYNAALEYFRDWATGANKKYADWNATWRNACRSWLKERLGVAPVGTTEDKHGLGW